MFWIYKKRDATLNTSYQVGYYDPTKKFSLESIHPDPDRAAARVSWLNGGMIGAYGRKFFKRGGENE